MTANDFRRLALIVASVASVSSVNTEYTVVSVRCQALFNLPFFWTSPPFAPPAH